MASSSSEDALNLLSSTLQSSSFSVTKRPNDPNRPHPRLSRFKQDAQAFKDGETRQEARRKAILTIQRQRRDDFLSHARNLVQGVVDDNNEDEEGIDYIELDGTDETNEGSEMEVEERKARKYKPKPLRKSYKNQLMESEWLVEIPSDFPDSWSMVLCPVGRRSLVVAGDGKTLHYSRAGHFVSCFPSNLPGGRRGSSRTDKMTILDCIFTPETSTFYILDVMFWDILSLYECDTQFRRFWLLSKFAENSRLSERSKTNRYPFEILPSYPCGKEAMAEVFNNPNLAQNLDGILFFHNDVHYLPGFTPLVGWLKGYMIPDMFGVPVCDQLMRQAPSDYHGLETISEKHDNYIANRNEEKGKSGTKHDLKVMDCSEAAKTEEA